MWAEVTECGGVGNAVVKCEGVVYCLFLSIRVALAFVGVLVFR